MYIFFRNYVIDTKYPPPLTVINLRRGICLAHKYISLKKLEIFNISKNYFFVYKNQFFLYSIAI